MSRIWKGAFSPNLAKHCGSGDIAQHIIIAKGGWDLDGNVLTVEFKFPESPQVYTAEIELEWEYVVDGVDDELVIELIAEQLALPPAKRTWSDPRKK